MTPKEYSLLDEAIKVELNPKKDYILFFNSDQVRKSSVEQLLHDLWKNHRIANCVAFMVDGEVKTAVRVIEEKHDQRKQV